MKHNYGANSPLSVVNDVHPYGYNGVEESDELGYNMNEMLFRHYDPAIGRFAGIDPIIHHNYSPYQAFDNSPVFWSDPSGADAVYNWDDGKYYDNGNEVSFADALASHGYNSDGSKKKKDKEKNKSNTEEAYIQRHPDKIDFNNVNTEAEKENFLDRVVEWSGWVNKFGSKTQVRPGTMIDFYTEPKVDKSFSEKLWDFIDGLGGVNTDDDHSVKLTDGQGNFVNIGYNLIVQEKGQWYAAEQVYFEHNYDGQFKYHRISITNGSARQGGRPPAIIFMNFVGQNDKFYQEIKNRILSYKYESVKITPYKKK
ncbi:RHS repeat domain-containing protein [Pseudofulvibacter geojedonensis]|uniref:RHS repeat domain-containing protein n=1 Tax=Pseudofulvibacter geojedonensis TaxID=1123758 RepID=A0ABW3I0T9_9FLAO